MRACSTPTATSPLLAATNPAVVSYDPAFAFEIGHIMEDGLRRMYGDDPENVIYYITVYNEPMSQPAEPEDVDREGILRGHVPLRRPASPTACRTTRRACSCSRPASGVPWALEAQELLRNDWGVVADVWSVTSWSELRRDGMACDEQRFLHPDGEARTPYVTERLRGTRGPVIAVSDYMRQVQDQIQPWVPGRLRVARRRRVRLLRHPARPPGASSTSTARRSRCGRCRCSCSAASSTPARPVRRPRATACSTSPPARPATPAARADRGARPGRRHRERPASSAGPWSPTWSSTAGRCGRSTASRPADTGAPFVAVDLTDYGQVVEALSGGVDEHPERVDAVVHLAAVPAPGLTSNAATFANNAAATYNVFAAARALGIRSVVWASSETVLGLPFDTPPPYVPVDEEYPPRPESTYSMTKALEEEMARHFCRWDPELTMVGLRFSNVMDPEDYAAFPAFDADPQLRRWNLWGYIDARDGAQAVRLGLERPSRVSRSSSSPTPTP